MSLSLSISLSPSLSSLCPPLPLSLSVAGEQAAAAAVDRRVVAVGRGVLLLLSALPSCALQDTEELYVWDTDHGVIITSIYSSISTALYFLLGGTGCAESALK